MRIGFALSAALALSAASPVVADVKEASESGFTVGYEKRIAASPMQVWAALIVPSRWWSSEHSWSGSAANFSLDPQAGGCFCERWGANSVQHARVVYAAPGQLLRLSGAFGPLQAEALSGTLSFTLKPDGAGTLLTAEFVVGGHAGFSLKDIAPAVDGVLGEQVQTLAALFAPKP